jgi:hypothetical protein
MMGRIYFDDAPDVLAEDQAAIREGLTTAYAAVQVTQAEAAATWLQHGAPLIVHQVGEPGRAGDPDISRDASD